MSGPGERRTLTFLFTDIEGSTALLQRLGHEAYTVALADHHAIVRAALADFGGTERNTAGDGFFAVFESPSAAVSAALSAQRGLLAHDWPQGEKLRARMGLHVGEASEGATGLVGLDVHRAARVSSVGHGGQVLLSGVAAALVRGNLEEGVSLRDLGYHRLKDLGQPEQIFQLDHPDLPGGHPALRSLDNPALPNNLPSLLANFVGREREVTEVRQLVNANRLVTLTGAGGAGKTRLSLQVAADLLDEPGDGVWLVELAAVTGDGPGGHEAVASAVCDVLDVPARSAQLRLSTLVDALAPQRCLLVLDNCEHLLGQCSKVADAVLRRCPHVHLLVTSREPLGIGGETIFRVPSLSLPGPDEDAVDAGGTGGIGGALRSDAVALFLERAAAQGAGLGLDGATRALVTSVCRRLDGMPLAIELAAARLRSMSLTDVHDRLDQRFRLLTGGSRSALERQQTLRATVDWSYSLLGEHERVLLQRLSVFAEGFDLEAAEAVCGFGEVDGLDVLDLLSSLVDKSLVVADQEGVAMRYRLLETIRQFGAERLVANSPSDAAALVDRHGSYYLALAEKAHPHLTGPGQAQWFDRLDGDLANVRRAVERAVTSTAGTEHALRFAAALERYLWARGHVEMGSALFVPVLDKPGAAGPPELLTEALVATSLLTRHTDLPTSVQLAGRAVRLSREIGDQRLMARSLSVLAGVLYFAGDGGDALASSNGDALAISAEGVDQARATGDDELLAEALVVHLLHRMGTGGLSRAEMFGEAVMLTERAGDHFLASILHNNAGVQALRDGDMAMAKKHLEEALRYAGMVGSQSYHMLVNLGWAYREEGNSPEAQGLFDRALRLCRRTGDSSGMAYTLLGHACLSVDGGDWAGGARWHGQAQAFLDRTGEAWQSPETSYRQQSIELARSKLGPERFEQELSAGVLAATTLPPASAPR